MANTVKINTKEELLKHAGAMVLKSNLEQLINDSVIENTNEYADRLQKIKDITPENGAWDFINSADEHLAEYANAQGEYIAHLVAASICDNSHGIKDVKFEVPNALKQEIKQAATDFQQIYDQKKSVVKSDFDTLNFITYDLTAENANRLDAVREGLENPAVLPDNDSLTRRGFTNTKMNLNMYACKGLTMDNYAKRLGNINDHEAGQWAVNAIDNMVRGLYTNEGYQQLFKNKDNIINSIYIDGKSAAAKYIGKNSYEEKCAAIISDVLSGGHKINVRGVEKVNGVFTESDKVASVDIVPNVACEEKFSLWKAILRFFGIGKTDKQKFEEKISFSKLGNEEAIEKIRSYDLTDHEFADKIAPVRAAEDKSAAMLADIDRYVFDEILDNPNKHFKDASLYYGEYDKNGNAPVIPYLKTLARQSSRTSMLMTYAMSKGMTLDAMLNPTEADKQQLKEYGREFTDIVTLPTREDIAKQVYPDYTPEQLETVIKTNDRQFRDAYDSAVEAKAARISEMYGQLTKTLSKFGENLKSVNYMDMQAVAEALPTHRFFSLACCDLLQTTENSPLTKNEAVKEAVKFGGDSQFRSPLRTMFASAIATPEITLKIPYERNITALSGALATVAYLQPPKDTANCVDTDTVNLSSFQGALNNELTRAAKDPNGAVVFQYAKDIITGSKPVPEGLLSLTFNEKGAPQWKTNLIRCYNQDVTKRMEQTLDNSKGL